MQLLREMPHPLDPLSPEELREAVGIARSSKYGITERTIFHNLELYEPPKSEVRKYVPSDVTTHPDREVRIEVYNEPNKVFWGIINLTKKEITQWEQIPTSEGHPAMQFDEMDKIEKACKKDPKLREILRQRGVEDLDAQLIVDPGPAGSFGLKYEEGNVRVCAVWLYARALGEPWDCAYAHPIDGVTPIVDVNKLEIIAIELHEPNPPNPHPGNYLSEFIQQRKPLKPLEITQPEGPDFTVDGTHVKWADTWSFRVGFNAREGLVLRDINFHEHPFAQKKSLSEPSFSPEAPQTPPPRPVVFRASMCEMTVPYGDPRPNHFRKNAFDAGEYGIGKCADSLKLGCDCKGLIHYFDAYFIDSVANIVKIDNAICMHEEDYGVLWKHYDWRINKGETRRSRRLVISFWATIGNYVYGFFWYLYLDGSIHFETKLTGIMNTGAELPDPTKCPPWGTLVGPGGAYGVIHQHFFCVRLHMDVDGDGNSIYEVNYEASGKTDENPQANAFVAKATLLPNEDSAKRNVNTNSGRKWKVVNPNKINKITGQPVGYNIEPGQNAIPYVQHNSSMGRRANYLFNHLWVTPYEREERFPAGEFPTNHPGFAGLPRYTAKNRSLVNKDLVVWYVMGTTHDPRPEDWPIMPCAYVSMSLKPHGFFDRNPTLNLAADKSKHDSRHTYSCCATANGHQ